MLGCKKENPVTSQSPYGIEGRYQYHGYELDSTLCTYGVVDVLLNDTIVTGNRNIQAVDTINSQNIEFGIGNISGFMYRDSTFSMYLVNPGFPTIELLGKFSPGLITGPRIYEHGARPKPPVIGHYTLQKQQ